MKNQLEAASSSTSGSAAAAGCAGACSEVAVYVMELARTLDEFKSASAGRFAELDAELQGQRLINDKLDSELKRLTGQQQQQQQDTRISGALATLSQVRPDVHAAYNSCRAAVAAELDDLKSSSVQHRAAVPAASEELKSSSAQQRIAINGLCNSAEFNAQQVQQLTSRATKIKNDNQLLPQLHAQVCCTTMMV
jgi:hypothetical protein